MTSESGDQITFEYNRPLVPIGTTGNYWAFNDYSLTPTDEQVAVVVEGSSAGYNPNESIVTYTGVERSYTELTKIISSQGYIELVRSSTQREDTQFEKYALKGIKVYSTATTTPTLIHDIEFVQDYLISG